MFGAGNIEWISRDTLSYADRLRIQNWGDSAFNEDRFIMKVNELCNELNRLEISKELYSIIPLGMPNEKLCLVCEDEWKIFYSERGSRTGEKAYPSEEEACKAFLEKLKRFSKIGQ